MKIANSLKRFIRFLDVDVNDLMVLVGLAISAKGIWMIHPPTAWIVVGAVVLAIGVLRSR